MTFFLSLFAYAFSKNAGGTSETVNAAIASELRKCDGADWPGFRTLYEARHVGDGLDFYFDCSTLIAKARGRAAGAFLAKGRDLWLTVDDDVEASSGTIQRLLAMAESTRGIVLGAYRCRGDTSRWSVSKYEPGDYFRDVMWGSLGLAAIHRDAVTRMAAAYPGLVVQEGEARWPALFLEEVRGGEWIGEDRAFCERARACGVPVHAMFESTVVHAGLPNVELLRG